MVGNVTDLFNKLGLPTLEIAPVADIEVLPAVREEDQNSDRLTRLVDTGLSVLEEVLEQPTPPLNHANYLKMLSIKKDAAVSVINAGLKADENRFRKRKNDVLGELLKQINSEKKGPPVINQQP